MEERKSSLNWLYEGIKTKLTLDTNEYKDSVLDVEKKKNGIAENRNRDVEVTSGDDIETVTQLQGGNLSKDEQEMRKNANIETKEINNGKVGRKNGAIKRRKAKITNKLEVTYSSDSKKKRINQYEIGKVLGNGVHGIVRMVTDIYTGKKYAVKIFEKRPGIGAIRMMRYTNRKYSDFSKEYDVEALQRIQREIAIMQRCRHSNIIELKEVIDDYRAKRVFLVLEYAEKGAVKWQTRDKKPKLSIKEARKIFRGLVLGVECLHNSGVIHRDIKPTNLLMSKNGEVKLSDFGVSYIGPHKTTAESGGEDDAEIDEQEEMETDVDEKQDGYLQKVLSFNWGKLKRGSIVDMQAKLRGVKERAETFNGVDGKPVIWESSEEFDLSDTDEFMSSDSSSESDGELVIGRKPKFSLNESFSFGSEEQNSALRRHTVPENVTPAQDKPPVDTENGTLPVIFSSAPYVDDIEELEKTAGTPAFFAPELCCGEDEYSHYLTKYRCCQAKGSATYLFEESSTTADSHSDMDLKTVENTPEASQTDDQHHLRDSTRSAPRSTSRSHHEDAHITNAIDIWSMGVTLYSLAFGKLPFLGTNEYDLFNIIPRKRVRFPNIPKNRSNNNLLNLISRMLDKDFHTRITIQQIKAHPWVTEDLSPQQLSAWLTPNTATSASVLPSSSGGFTTRFKSFIGFSIF